MTKHGIKRHDTFYTKCGRGRTTYRPDWSDSLPFAIYRDGTATIHKATLEDCAEYFKQWKMELVIT